MLRDEAIEALAPPDTVANGAARIADAAGWLVIPGLINGHTHSHGGLAKGPRRPVVAGTAAECRRLDERRPLRRRLYVSAVLSALENLRTGCTACYDLPAMLPVPAVAGLNAIAQAYADVGIRAVIAPMISDISLHHAIPCMLEALSPDLRPQADSLRLPQATRRWPQSAPPPCAGHSRPAANASGLRQPFPCTASTDS